MDLTLIAHFRDEIVLLGLVVFGVIAELIFRRIKKQLKNQIATGSLELKNPAESETYISYYRKSQIIDILRVIGLASGIFAVIMLKAPSAFNFALVATGAIIVTFKEVILSFASFFLVVSQYKVGETISVAGIQGEIIYIRPLYVGILGKDENGEHTGQLYYVPNIKFLSEPVKKEELRLTAYKKETVLVRYNSRQMTVTLQEFIEKLSGFLDERLIVRDALHVGNFRSFAGYRYKLDFTSDKDGIILEISFIGRSLKNAHIKRDIYIFTDTFAQKNGPESRHPVHE